MIIGYYPLSRSESQVATQKLRLTWGRRDKKEEKKQAISAPGFWLRHIDRILSMFVIHVF